MKRLFVIAGRVGRAPRQAALPLRMQEKPGDESTSGDSQLRQLLGVRVNSALRGLGLPDFQTIALNVAKRCRPPNPELIIPTSKRFQPQSPVGVMRVQWGCRGGGQSSEQGARTSQSSNRRGGPLSGPLSTPPTVSLCPPALRVGANSLSDSPAFEPRSSESDDLHCTMSELKKNELLPFVPWPFATCPCLNKTGLVIKHIYSRNSNTKGKIQYFCGEPSCSAGLSLVDTFSSPKFFLKMNKVSQLV